MVLVECKTKDSGKVIWTGERWIEKMETGERVKRERRKRQMLARKHNARCHQEMLFAAPLRKWKMSRPVPEDDRKRRREKKKSKTHARAL